VPKAPRLLPHPPAFFLAEPVSEGRARLLPEDEQHARRVLRLGSGDLVLGLDGQGNRWPLRIRGGGSQLLLEPAGPVERTPAPGEPGSVLPWIEVAVSWPRKNRVEGMVSRLVQLGAAALLPLEAAQRGPERTPAVASERTLKVVREACKQCGRSWLAEIEPARTPLELVRSRKEAQLALLDPRCGMSFDTWLRSLQPSANLGTRARPIVLVIGPEGGFTAEERLAFLECGASPVWIGPHVLRVETAAEAAMAVAAAVLGLRPELGQS
jgi:16S rRNA (uracil1498-N3)-methyltransferase